MVKLIKANFNDTPVTFNSNGWINATAIASKNNKRVADWVVLTSTQEYISALGMEASELIQSTKGKGGGTYLSKELAGCFLTWVYGTNFSIAAHQSIHNYQSIIESLNNFDVPEDLPEMFVYAIKELGTGNVKLGISRDPEARLRQMQIGNSSKLELVAYIKAENRFKDEKKQHALNSDYHIHGEWFTGKAELIGENK